jgi:hypothetical protein
MTALQRLWVALVEDVEAHGGQVEKHGLNSYAIHPPQGRRWAAWPEETGPRVFQLPTGDRYRRKRKVRRM